MAKTTSSKSKGGASSSSRPGKQAVGAQDQIALLKQGLGDLADQFSKLNDAFMKFAAGQAEEEPSPEEEADEGGGLEDPGFEDSALNVMILYCGRLLIEKHELDLAEDQLDGFLRDLGDHLGRFLPQPPSSEFAMPDQPLVQTTAMRTVALASSQPAGPLAAAALERRPSRIIRLVLDVLKADEFMTTTEITHQLTGVVSPGDVRRALNELFIREPSPIVRRRSTSSPGEFEYSLPSAIA